MCKQNHVLLYYSQCPNTIDNIPIPFNASKSVNQS